MENNNTNQNTQTKKTNSARDKYNKLVQKFISDLEQGTKPWEKSWNLENGLPTSATTGGQYSGINLISLMSEDKFKSNQWITAKQAQKLGGSIIEQQEENSKDIFFLKNMTKLVEKEDKATGEIKEVEETYKILRSYQVYNTEQVDGINFQEEPKSKNEIIKEIEEFIKSFNLVMYRGNPAYSAKDDCIFMPDIYDFKDKENYYSTLFHELSHWTNNQSRIDRSSFLKKYNEKAYGIEELIAEMSSAFLCANKGISMDTTQHSEYLNAWVQNLKENPYILFSASSQASKATNYLEKLSLKNIEQEQGKTKTKSQNKFNTPKVA